MKSDKAKEYLLECVKAVAPLYPDDAGECDLKLKEAKRAVELAEQEAEERVRTQLLRWRDPKKKLPENDDDVLIKTPLPHKYQVAFYKASAPRNYHWHENNGSLDDDMVIGWRPIEE